MVRSTEKQAFGPYIMQDRDFVMGGVWAHQSKSGYAWHDWRRSFDGHATGGTTIGKADVGMAPALKESLNRSTAKERRHDPPVIGVNEHSPSCGRWKTGRLCARPSGVTLIELLVVVALIGILIAILLPSVQAVRESSRRLKCQNNLKQLSLGVIAHEAMRRSFPAAIVAAAGSDAARASSSTTARSTWVITVLPLIEEQSLFDSFDHAVSPADSRNANARATPLEQLMCPTDIFNRQPFMGSQGTSTASWGDNWARGNYAGNGALGVLGISWWSTAATLDGWRNRVFRGVMGFNRAVSSQQVVDGLSKTVLLGEVRAGVHAVDNRGVWAMGTAGSSSLWAHGGIDGDAYGPNCAEPYADDIFNCSQVRAAIGNSSLEKMNMGCWQDSPPMAGQATARSLHANGVYVGMADGSVRWIDDNIESRPSTELNLSIWDRLMLSADGQPVNY